MLREGEKKMTKRNGTNGEEKTEYGFLVTIDSHVGYAREEYNVFKTTVVKLPGDGKIDTLSSYEGLADLVIRDQQSISFPALDNGRVFYDASYQTVDLQRAKMYFGTLTKIENALERERVNRGYPADYAETLVRIALALGIKKIVRPTPAAANGYEYQYYDLAGGVYWIRHEVAKWIEQHTNKENASV